MVGAGYKLALPFPTLHVQASVYFCNFTAELYIFARLRRITFSFGNVTATEVSSRYVSEAVTGKVSPSSTAVTLLR